MWLSYQIKEYIFWLFSVLKKFIGITALPSVLSIFLMLISMLSQTIAFFLPLKVVLLIGSTSAPDIFNVIFGTSEKNELIIRLSFVTVAIYFLYLFSNYYFNYWVDKGAFRLVKKSQKILLYSDQGRLAKKYYGKMCGSVAAIIFILIGFIVGLYLYFYLYVFFLVILLILFTLFSIACLSDGFRVTIANTYAKILEIASGVTFLLLFGFIVISYLMNGESNLVLTIISLMLGRQIMQRLVTTISDGVFLSENRLRFNTLFYSGLHYQLATDSNKERKFIDLCRRDVRNKWLSNIFIQDQNRFSDKLKSYWHQLGASNFVGFSVFDNSGDELGFVKIYGTSRKGFAEHEYFLLNGNWAKDLPAPKLQNKLAIDLYECLVFQEIGSKVKSESKAEAYMSVLSTSWSVEPVDYIVNKYSRSKPMLSERLDSDAADILYEAANTKESRAAVKKYITIFPGLVDLLKSIPLSINNPDLRLNFLYQLNNGDYLSPHWGRWGIEPVGFGWRECDFEFIDYYLNRAKKKRPELESVTKKQIQLVALLSKFELHLRSHSYVSALEMLPNIFTCLDISD